MKRTAVIDGREYRFMEELPSLGEPSSFVLCANPDGRQYICPKDFWTRHATAATPDPSAPIHAKSIPQEKTALFLSLFRGRENLYARRYHSLKTGKSGYVPACQNEWKPGVCDKRARKCPDCPSRAFLPLTANVIRAHLWGRDAFCRDVVGIYPMLEDGRTWLLAADFDEEAWREDAAAFRDTCLAFDITPAVERSRSGNGAHIWFFFSEPVPAADARRLGSGLLTQAMARRHELRFASDLNGAARDILIVSPSLKKFQVKAVLPALEKAAAAGAAVTIRTRPPESCPPAQEAPASSQAGAVAPAL